MTSQRVKGSRLKRIGPKMRMVVAYVAVHPGCPKIGPAWYASPWPGKPARSCGLAYGYRAVDRAMRAGLVSGELRGSAYVLSLTPEGEKLTKTRFLP